MPLPTAVLRVAGILAAGTLGLGLLASCAPTPESTPTPTPTAASATAAFATDEEAFAAAEKTYAEYVEAGNARDRGKEAPDPQDYLIGAALEGHIDAVRFFKLNNVTATGNVKLVEFRPAKESLTQARDRLEVVACLNIAENRMLDAKGRDITPAGRPEVVASLVQMVIVREQFRIAKELEHDNRECD